MKQSNGFIQEPMATQEVEHVEKEEVSPEVNNVSIGPPSCEIASLAIKPKTGVPIFKQSAIYKSRLKLEELYIPKPLAVEYLYCVTTIFSFVALRALSRNLASLKTFAAGTVVFGIGPLLFIGVYYFNDVYEYAEKKNEANVEKWQDFPVALYYYGFVLVAFQVHMFSLFFAAKLLKIWRSKAKRF